MIEIRRRALLGTVFTLLAGTVTTAVIQPRSEHPLARYDATLLAAAAPPQGNGYTYRRTITIDHTKVPNTDQSNFPVLISGTYSYLATLLNGGNVQNANGYDVIFTSDAACATKLNHEVQTYTAATGAVNYWVKVPSVSHTTDTTIYLCYGNSAITTDQSNKTGVWDSNFKAVYHLEDQAANTTVSDSTANGTNGVNAANTSGKSVTGKLGKALTFNGSTDNTTTAVTQTGSFTWECWFQLTNWTTQTGSSNYSTLMAGTYASGGALLMLWMDSAYMVQFASDNVGGITSGNNSVAPGAWHHAAYTRTGNSGSYALYFDGVFKGQVASGTNNTSTTITLGRRTDATAQALNGLLDETRISNIARSADWFKTEYNNQSSPATFYSISASNSCCDTATARLDPLNATGGRGENPLSRNFNWSLPLVQLPGRAGLDLGLSLAYNSLVWTRSGSSISFDDDRGFPGPGFRLGFPVIQPLYYNSEVGKNAFLLIGTDGGRTELRQVGTSALYESADSSHLLLDSGTMILRSTDGTQLKYQWQGSEYDCVEIKDRNGNYITINYTAFSRIDTVTDTLGRNIKFNYDVNGWLTSITQIWNQGPNQIIHSWATFDYATTTINTNFSGLTSYGLSNGSTLKNLSKVTLADGSHFDFSYTSWGQVWKVSNFAADNHLLNYRSYNLPQTGGTAYTDCPRFTERHDWAENWNQNVSGVEQEAITAYAEPVADSWTMPDNTAQTGMRAQVTTPDLTSNKIYFIGTAGTASGWRRGLPALVVTSDSGGVWQRKVMTTWTQDNESLSYPLNPRVTETNTYDPAGNRARVQTTYLQVTFANGTSCQLPRDVYEYAADGSTKLRSTRTDYNTAPAYSDRHIIGLVSEKKAYEGDVNNGGVLASKVGFFYDNENNASSIQGNDEPVQHDHPSYGATFVTGRANLSSVKRYDVTDTNHFTTTTSKYNTAGSVVSTADALGHTTQLSYTDSFSDGVARTTLAYPTKLIDPDNYYSTATYNFDFGAMTSRKTPPPNYNGSPASQPAGPEQTITFDTLGRLERVTNQVNGAYTHYAYSNAMTRVDTYTTIQEGLGEAHSFQITDGAGRVIASASDHPGPVNNRFSGQKFVYDVMGRTSKTSNPTETSALNAPSQWVTTGDDQNAGWIYTQQTYDWKGRPLVTTNQDGTTKTASYTGCGCAGGEVVTLIDEGTLVAGALKKRQQKIYSDVLGRTVKTELLDWEGGTPYSTTVNTYGARDQITQIKQYAGSEGSGTFQVTTMSYDGYGRLASKHIPEQDSGTATVYAYNNDDTVLSITDARGARATHTYNSRHLLTAITYTAPAGITATPAATFGYDAAGNRITMTDGLGSKSYNYDLLSRLTSESRTFTNVGTFSLTYDYNLAGQLKKITDASNTTINYGYNIVGQLISVTGSDVLVGGISTYASGLQYRAWGELKQLSIGTLSTSFNYNSRAQVTNFNISGVVNENYDYHNDGRLSFVQNTTDSNFDRTLSYDHVGRLTFAAAGGDARGDTGPVPFSESISYNAFNDITQRETETWGGGYYFDFGNYTNHRSGGWEYDASGRITTIGARTYTYDAAGRNVTLTGQRWTPSGYIATSTESDFDGDGNRVKENSGTSGSMTLNYYLRSSVLGMVVEELNSSGQKQYGYVYTPSGVELALQVVGQNYVHMKQRSPLGTTERGMFSTGSTSRTELDPVGATVRTNPNSPPDHGGNAGDITSGGSGSLDGRFASMSNPLGGCLADGVLMPCTLALRGEEAISSVEYVDPYYAAQSRGRHQKSIWIDEDTSYGVQTGENELTIYSGSGGHFEWIDDPDEVLEQSTEPQNPSPNVDDLQSRIAKMVSNPDCAKFISNLINGTATTKNPAEFTDALKGFEKIKGQGGFIYGDTIEKYYGFRGGTVHGTVSGGNAQVELPFPIPFRSFGPVNQRAAAGYAEAQAGINAMTALHEILHLAGKNQFSDYDYANTVAAMRGVTPPTFANVRRASEYWTGALEAACKPR